MDDLNRMVKLRHLDISVPNLTSGDLKNVELKALAELTYHELNFGDTSAKQLIRRLQYHPKLDTLVLVDLMLTKIASGVCFFKISQTYSHFTSKRLQRPKGGYLATYTQKRNYRVCVSHGYAY